MKTLKRLLILVMIFAMTLTACQKQPASQSGDGQNSEVVNTQQDTQQGEEGQAGEEEIVVQKSAILEQGTTIDDAGILYQVPNDRIESTLQQEIAFYQENLLVWGSNENGFSVYLISLQTGEVLQEKNFEGMDLPAVQICGEKIAVTDWGTGQVTILDSAFEELSHHETETIYCSIYLNEDASNIYCFTQEEIKVIEVASGDTTTLLENATILYASTKCGNTVGVSYTDEDTQMNVDAIVDLSTGTVEESPFTEAVYGVEYGDGTWVARKVDDEVKYYIGKADRPKMFTLDVEHALVTLVPNPLRLMVTTFEGSGSQTMTLYSLDGKFLSRCEVPDSVASVIYEPIWSEADGGYFFTGINQSGKDVLLFWDLSTPISGVDLSLTAAYEETADEDSTLSTEVLDRVEEIANTYEIDVFVGDQTDTSASEYNMAQEMNEDYIMAGLDALESACSKYPDGFMKQLLYSNQKSLEFHLTGAFSLKEYPEGDVNGFTSYIGLACEGEGKNVIYVDITMAGSIEQTLHHEIMHIINNKLVFDAMIREDALYSEDGWNALNPKDFTYVEDKYHLPESIYSDGYDSYFIDIYSRTYANEDRARIMEYAMVDADWAFSDADGRREKLSYLCDCIRDAFDTEGWPEKTHWEKTLGRSK
ncbi:MAG: hypothetical protein IJ958_10420 [Agathobacter sp.]|nr:hypothetical protein [Agathobacter sp.]